MAISYLLEPTAKLISKFIIPFKGTWKTLPSHLIPPDALSDSLNVTIQGGALRSRPGLQMFNLTSLGEIKGTFLYVDALVGKSPLAVSNNKFWQYTPMNTWVDKTNSQNITPVGNYRQRMTSIQQSNQFRVVLANGSAGLFYFDGGLLQAIVPSTGTIPMGIIDVCTSFSRIVGLIPPYTVVWSSIFDISTWPDLNTNILSDTPDPLVTIKNLGTLGFAIYKEGSIYTAFGQSGSAAASFRFEFRGEFEGPANPNALVSAQGIHYGFTPSGRIFSFDGSKHEYIADGIWPFLRDDVDINYLYKIHGVYSFRQHTIYFWYPRKGQGGQVKGIVLVNLPYPKAGLDGYTYFLGESAFSCTDSLGTVLFQNTSGALIFGDDISFVLNPDYQFDNMHEIPVRMNTPLITTPNNVIVHPTFEVYLRRGSHKGTVFLSSLTSNLLENDAGESSEVERIDLTQFAPNEFISFENQGSFVGFKLEGTAADGIEYLGADVYGRETG